MTVKKAVVSIMIALVLTVNLAGCASAGASSKSVTVTDTMGRQVQIPANVETVVAADPAACEIVAALGAEALLVGRGSYCNYPESVMSLPEVANDSGLSTEQTIALKPDLVLVSYTMQTPEQIQALEDAGIAALYCDYKSPSIAETYTVISMIGTSIGKTAEADKLIAQMKDTFANLPKVGDGKTFYYEASPLEYGLWAAGKNTFIQEIGELLGMKNIFDDTDGWNSVSQEQVIERNPDYIITVAMYFGEGPQPAEEIKSREGWQNISAVKNNGVYQADSDEISRPGPRLAQAAEKLAEFIGAQS